MKIRPARAADAGALCALMLALNAEQEDRTDLLAPGDVAALIAADGAIILVAQEAEGTLAGYATAHPTYETAHAEHGLYVGDL